MESTKAYFGESTMTGKTKSIGEFARHLMMVMLVNVVAVLLLVDAYFVEAPMDKLMAGIRIMLACWALMLAVNWIRGVWKNVKHPGYYFLPTTFLFWALGQRRRRLNAETGIARIRETIASWPDTSLEIITGIVDPAQQEGTLSRILGQMDAMRDSYLATITDRIRRYLGEILESVGNNGNYHLFRQVMSRLSSHEPASYRLTHKRFMLLLSDVFDPSLTANFGRLFQKHMIGPLKNAIAKAAKTQPARAREIIAKIMANNGGNHEIANGVAEMLLQLDWNDDRETCRIIFDESMKRAFRFPKHFGIEFLLILSRLEHKVFWLDIKSLREMLEESLSQEGAGLIDLNQGVYGEICSKVLAPLEDPARDGVCNARVFRRIKGDGGRVGIECVCSNGQECRCEGESLSFRGIYSRDCRRAVGEKLAMNVIPIEQFDRKFAVKASVAPLHTYESASQGPGRGAFFEDAEPSTVKGLYDYVSTNK
jgi:hypothetical protein